MPVAVMADSAFSFRKLLDQCENQELEAPGGIATPPVYGQLLALYLLQNDMNNARYLWKRIPPAIKSSLFQSEFFQRQQFLLQANSELGGIWSVGQRIWQRDFPGIYTTINAHQWSETVQPIMEALRGVLEQGWQADSATRMVLPRKPASGALDASFNRFIPLSAADSAVFCLDQAHEMHLDLFFSRCLTEPAPVPPIPNEQQLARLTDYVAFLEN
ncbi:hypothetical protein U0070_007967 [Myodes glareolus]|uniref:CSN8/PSMD8/EIF3K domain-containing protein n=1 Tax=Myodes glareolus TaxID=447135 RepID=A0AAW0IG86_MYOGA